MNIFKKKIDLDLELEKLWSEILINDLVWLMIYSKQELVLEKAWKKFRANNEWNGISTGNLIWLLMYSKEESIEKKAWKELKTNGKLTSTNMFDLTDGPKLIQKELLKMFLEQGSPENLAEAIKSVPGFAKKAKIKLFGLIKKGVLNIGQAKDILTKIIEQIPPLRQEALLLLFQKLDPSQTELQRILDMGAIQRDPVMRMKVQDFIRKAAKKNLGSITAQEIEKLEKQLEKPKKEQN